MNSVIINYSQIEWETASAALIKVPRSDYKFWYPKKYIQSCSDKRTRFRILFLDDFEYKLFKNGKGKYNQFKKIDEYVEDYEEILNLFGYKKTEEANIIYDLIDSE